MSFATGTRLGPYEILNPAGAGGMGEVYKARDTRLQRTVAIKVLPADRTGDLGARQRLEREAHAVAVLSHPHICSLFDIGHEGETDYLVMEFLEGETLAQRLTHGKLPFEQALQYAIQIADALTAAHKAGIIHRDLKPGNIILGKSGLKVLDFGLAIVIDRRAVVTGDETLTAEGMVVGTPAYMAPEQRAGKRCDPRADLYALGVVLTEMATGRRLSSGEPLPPDLPRDCAFIVERCLAADPDERWHSAADIRWALEWLASSELRRPPSGPRSTELALARLSVDLGPNAVPGLRSTAVLSPDGRRIAFLTRCADGKQRIATRLLQKAEATPLNGTENAQDPFFSPDGQWLGFFADYRLKRVSVLGGAPMTVCEAPNDRGASWADDDSIVLAPHIFGGLVRVHAAGGVPEPLTSLDDGETAHAWPQVIPGGRAVLFTGGAANAHNLKVLSLTTGQIKIVVPAGYRGRYAPSGHVVYVHRNTLLAVRFDIDALEPAGVPVPIVDDVADDVTDRTAHFDLANDGTLVYLSRDAVTSDRTIGWMDRSGHVETLLDAPGRYSYLAPSPDGRNLAYVSGQDIWILDLKRRRPSRVSFNTIGNQWPVWAPDSAHLVFSAQGRSGGRTLWWLRADGGEEPQLLLDSADEVHPSSISPDGKYVAIHRRSVETLYDIWMLPLDCADPEQPKAEALEVFLRTPANEWGAVFSPEGRWVAYYSEESGTGEIYVRPFRARGGPWLISTGGISGTIAHWPKGGRALFYLSPDRRIMEVTYSEEGNSFVADAPQRWSDTALPFAAFNVDPDATRAILALPAERVIAGRTLHVTFLLNFFDELGRRAPAVR